MPTDPSNSDFDPNDGDGTEFEIVGETDEQRRRTLLESNIGAEDEKGDVKTKGSWGLNDFEDDFDWDYWGSKEDDDGETERKHKVVREDDVIEISSDEEGDGKDGSCDLPVASGSTFTTGKGTVKRQSKVQDEIKGEFSL